MGALIDLNFVEHWTLADHEREFVTGTRGARLDAAVARSDPGTR